MRKVNIFLLAYNDAVHVGPKLFCEFLSSGRLDSSGESKIWSKCAVDFALHLLSLISQVIRPGTEISICSTHPENRKREELVQGLFDIYICLLST